MLSSKTCPSCKRSDVIFVDKSKQNPLKAKIINERKGRRNRKMRKKAREARESSKSEEIEVINQQPEMAKQPKPEQKENLSDSEDTDQMIEEIHEIEAKITYMMTEIAKAKQIVEHYDKKLTRRLEKKRKRKILEQQKKLEEEKAQQEQLQNFEREEIRQDIEVVDINEEVKAAEKPKGRTLAELIEMQEKETPVKDIQIIEEDKVGESAKDQANIDYTDEHQDLGESPINVMMKNRITPCISSKKDLDDDVPDELSLDPQVSLNKKDDDSESAKSVKYVDKLQISDDKLNIYTKPPQDCVSLNKNESVLNVDDNKELSIKINQINPQLRSHSNIPEGSEVGSTLFINMEENKIANENEVKIDGQVENQESEKHFSEIPDNDSEDYLRFNIVFEI